MVFKMHLLIFLFIFQKLYAKAIYDNVADTSDELAFRKGDVLAVIEQDADGCQGWWLCLLRGRQVVRKCFDQTFGTYRFLILID